LAQGESARSQATAGKVLREFVASFDAFPEDVDTTMREDVCDACYLLAQAARVPVHRDIVERSLGTRAF
jgi:hypothetical protein